MADATEGCRSPRPPRLDGVQDPAPRVQALVPPIRFFAEKVRTIGTLPQARQRMVRCVAEKPDPGAGANPASAAPGAGYVEGVTHGYIRHGTTTVFAALDVAGPGPRPVQGAASSSGVPELPQAHRGQHASRPRCPRVVDNYSTHKHAKVKRFAARPRYHIHFTPTTPPGSTWSSWFSHHPKGQRGS